MDTLYKYLEDSVAKWNDKERVDTSFDIKIKANGNSVNIYYVGYMGDIDLTWNFVFGVKPQQNCYKIEFFLDDVEEDIVNSLIKAGYNYRINNWFKEFDINLSSLEEVQSFLEKHVWSHDPGYFC